MGNHRAQGRVSSYRAELSMPRPCGFLEPEYASIAAVGMMIESDITRGVS